MKSTGFGGRRMLKKGDIVEIVNCAEANMYKDELWFVDFETQTKGHYRIQNLKSGIRNSYGKEYLKLSDKSIDVNLHFDNGILALAIHEYGECNQYFMVLEEIAELQKEVCKARRGFDNKSHLSEELADVYIMLEQLKIMENISDYEVQKIIDYKVKRLARRLESEE